MSNQFHISLERVGYIFFISLFIIIIFCEYIQFRLDGSNALEYRKNISHYMSLSIISYAANALVVLLICQNIDGAKADLGKIVYYSKWKGMSSGAKILFLFVIALNLSGDVFLASFVSDLTVSYWV